MSTQTQGSLLQRLASAFWRKLRTSPHWHAYALAEHGTGIPLKVETKYVHLDWREYSIFLRCAKGLTPEQIMKELRLHKNEYQTAHQEMSKRIGRNSPAELQDIARQNGLITP